MSLERRIVSAALEEEDFVNKIKSSGLKSHHFNNKNDQYVLNSILKLDRYGDFDYEVVKDFIASDDSLSEDRKDSLHVYIENVKDTGSVGANFSLEKLSSIAKKRETANLLNNLAEDLDGQKDIEEIISKVSGKVKDLKKSGTNYNLYDYFDSWEERQVERSKIDEASGETLSLGLNLSPFEKPYFERGLLPKQTTAIGGPTYAGKSVALINFIRLAAHPMNGFNVLYIVAENRYIEAASRLDSVILGKEYDELYDGGLHDKKGDEFFDGALEDGWGNIYVSKVTIDQFDASTIETMINDVETMSGDQIDVLAIDSPDHQRSMRNHDQWWQEKGAVYKENKELAEEHGLINLVTLPMKPSSVGGSGVTSEDTAGSYDIARYADNLIMFDVSPSDKQLNRGKLQVTKARDGNVDEETLYFYFEDNLRLLPWHEVFNGEVDPEGDDEHDIKYKIENFKSEKTVEKDDKTNFNVKKVNE